MDTQEADQTAAKSAEEQAKWVAQKKKEGAIVRVGRIAKAPPTRFTIGGKK